MHRKLAIAAILALAVPSIALAAPKGKGGPGGGGGAKTAPHFVPKGPPPKVGGTAHVVIHHGPIVVHPGAGTIHPGPVVAHGPFVFHGHPFAWHPVHFPHPWLYPAGFGYRLWTVGAILPPIFWSTPTYYYTDWATMGLPPPDPGFQYVEYGPDLLLVNTATGEVVQVFPGAFN
jgi:Nickel/cobalt transporter regulator